MIVCRLIAFFLVLSFTCVNKGRADDLDDADTTHHSSDEENAQVESGLHGVGDETDVSKLSSNGFFTMSTSEQDDLSFSQNSASDPQIETMASTEDDSSFSQSSASDPQIETMSSMEDDSSSSQNSASDPQSKRMASMDDESSVTQNGASDPQTEENVNYLPCSCHKVSDRYKRCLCDTGEDFSCLLVETTVRPLLRKRDDVPAEDDVHEEGHGDTPDQEETIWSTSTTDSTLLTSTEESSSSSISATSSLMSTMSSMTWSLAADDSTTAETDTAQTSVTEFAAESCRCNCSSPAKSTTSCYCMGASSDGTRCASFTCSVGPDMYTSIGGPPVGVNDKGLKKSEGNMRQYGKGNTASPGHQPTCFVVLLPLVIVALLSAMSPDDHRG